MIRRLDVINPGLPHRIYSCRRNRTVFFVLSVVKPDLVCLESDDCLDPKTERNISLPILPNDTLTIAIYELSGVSQNGNNVNL